MKARKLSRRWPLFNRAWRWARCHPGAIAVGTLLVATLLIPHSPSQKQPPADFEAGETPLFV